ncbi:MAG: alkaline phosphatase family protein [bacterium]
MKNNKRVIIIGLDGIPFELVKALSETEVMPNTKEIISQGILKRMESSIPEISSVAWSSIITGKNPAEHGIFGFTELHPNSYELRFPNFNDLKSSPFWDLIEGKSIIINVPATYPVKEINGVLISGFVSIDLEKSVYPKFLIPKLQELEYRLDVDSMKAHESLGLFLEDLDKTLKARIQTYRYLWRYTDWQVFMLVFTGTDRLMHFLWQAYENSSNPYHRDFLDHLHKIDEVIGEIAIELSDEDLLIILSDHGFERLDKEVYVNYPLKSEGFLKLKKSSSQSFLSKIDYSTKAFALDPGRIYINLKGKYPNGSVSLEDREKVIRDLEELFNSLEIENNKVIKGIYRKEQIYSGTFMDKAPDLVLVADCGFNLKGKLDDNTNLFDKGIFEGKHTKDNAFLLIRNQRCEIPDSPKVFDVANIILFALGK